MSKTDITVKKENKPIKVSKKDLEDKVIVNLDAARGALALAIDASEVKKIISLSKAMQTYARQQHLSKECKLQADALWLDAMKQLGVMDRPINPGTRGQIAGSTDGSGGAILVPPEHEVPTLEQQGLDKKESALSRKIAALPPEEYEAVRAGAKSINAALKALDDKKKKEKFYEPIKAELPSGIHHGDFRELSACIPDSSVELVLTDPPYDKDAIALYGDAARIAARILKPGGSFIAYSGQKYLPTVLALCGEHLRYWWTFALIHSSQNQMLEKLGVRCGWKPIVWFVKDTRGDVANVLRDTLTGDQEKTLHEWQQGLSEAEFFIKNVTSANGLVVDFCLGSGTTAIAARKLDRKCIGFEADNSSVNKIIERLK